MTKDSFAIDVVVQNGQVTAIHSDEDIAAGYCRGARMRGHDVQCHRIEFEIKLTNGDRVELLLPQVH